MSPLLPLLAAMAAHLPRLPFFILFVFLAVHVPASHGDPLPTTYHGSMCLESSFWCGGVEIRYPFYLANATEATTDYSGNYSCGYTDLEISCQVEGPSATPVISLGNENYTIQNISYDNFTIVLADSEVLGPDKCPAVTHNVSFDEEWLHYSTPYDSLNFYFSCYPPDRMPADLDTYKIECNGFKSPFGDGPSYLFTSDDPAKAQELEAAANCGEVVTVPVRHKVLLEHGQPMLARGGYPYVLKSGFELEWNWKTTDQCHLCEQSEGKCAYSQERGFLGCLCYDRTVGNPDCKNSGATSTVSPPSSLLERQQTGR